MGMKLTKPIGMHTGRLVRPSNLRSEDVSINEIAYNLSRINRYNGATIGEPYNVAEHSVHASHAVDQGDAKLCMAALMHDAAEAYLGDMLSPLKAGFKHYREVETSVALSIGTALGYTPSYRHDDVRTVDLALRRKEMQELTKFPENVYEELPEMELPSLICMPWKMSYYLFLARYHQLKGRIENGEYPNLDQRPLPLREDA